MMPRRLRVITAAPRGCIARRAACMVTCLVMTALFFPACACSHPSQLSPRITIGMTPQNFSGRIEQTLRDAEEETVWKPLMAWYVHAFRSRAADVFTSLAAATGDETKKLFFTRAAEVAGSFPEPGPMIHDGFTRFIDAIKASGAPGNAMKALDIGSGDGAFLRAAMHAGWARQMEIVGIDNSAAMIDAALYLHMVPVRQMDARRTVFADASFDLVFLNYPNPAYGAEALQSMFDEAFRVLRANGGLVLSSCEDPRNGFPRDEMMRWLVRSGYARDTLEIFTQDAIPASYPLAGSARQVQDQRPYCIFVRKRSVLSGADRAAGVTIWRMDTGTGLDSSL